MNEIKSEDIKIITTEVDRVPLEESIRFRYIKGWADVRRLCSPILRHDPDVVLVGEIRDLETAENATQASLTAYCF